MEIINLEGTEDTPKIILDKTNKIFEISGRSLPEDSSEFYQPIIDWLVEYAKDPLPETIFDFKLEYFNTASSKLILDLLTELEDIDNTKIKWYFYEDDEDMEEAGDEFSELVELDFELIPY